ncbi:MAG: GNAT family N-acetyltransferase [Rhodospirillaceae bacterium]|nr:GNAT family N-acetyltransferase [Rhodospirillaceae bacterium]
MSSLTLRRFTAADVDAYLAVRREGLLQDADAFRVSPDDDDAFGLAAWRERLDRDYVIGIEKDGRTLGIGGFARIPGAKTRHKGLIWGMYVRAEARGSGVADAVMDALLDYARGKVRQVQLTAVAANARAVAFYERHGFARYGVEPGSICLTDGNYADEMLMWRLV